VCWAGVISETIEIKDYWSDKRFACKKKPPSEVPDNIYKPGKGGALAQVSNNSHVPKDTKRDTGGDNVLIFEEKWHFGENGPDLPARFGLRMETNNRRGHRRHKECDAGWPGLRKWLREQEVVAPPTSATACGICGPRRHVHRWSVRKKCASVC
jgi:hypothetical protein